MPISEFELIEHYFHHDNAREDVVLGVGDDAALLRVPEGMLLASAVDTLISGVHFPESTAPAAIGWKSLAVNLSDLAAMGAEPAWSTLSLSLPQAGEAWLQEMAEGFFALADQCQVALVGGDTVRGPLVLTVQVNGFVPEREALTRAGAAPGDLIYVSGSLGDAAAGLAPALRGESPATAAEQFLRERLDRPTPRIELGRRLCGHASACIDLSDGLCADLGHIMERSHLGAAIDTSLLPISPALREVCGEEVGRHHALRGGDDYELCFTVSPQREAAMLAALAGLDVAITRIGEMTNEVGVLRIDGEAQPTRGYDHFREG